MKCLPTHGARRGRRGGCGSDLEQGAGGTAGELDSSSGQCSLRAHLTACPLTLILSPGGERRRSGLIGVEEAANVEIVVADAGLVGNARERVSRLQGRGTVGVRRGADCAERNDRRLTEATLQRRGKRPGRRSEKDSRLLSELKPCGYNGVRTDRVVRSRCGPGGILIAFKS